jgi:hypothetical protein
VDAIYTANGLVESPLDQAAGNHIREALQVQLGAAVWQRAWQEGRAMTLAGAIAYALEKKPTPD